MSIQIETFWNGKSVERRSFDGEIADAINFAASLISPGQVDRVCISHQDVVTDLFAEDAAMFLADIPRDEQEHQ